MTIEDLKPVMVAPYGVIEPGKTYLFQSIENKDGNFYNRENVDNYTNQLREENERLLRNCNRYIEIISTLKEARW